MYVRTDGVRRRYDNMVSNPPLCEAFRANIERLGTTYLSREDEAKLPGGSTDMGCAATACLLASQPQLGDFLLFSLFSQRIGGNWAGT